MIFHFAFLNKHVTVSPSAFNVIVEPPLKLVGVITMIALGFIPGYVISLVMKSMGWLRVPDEVQMAGIDSAELGLKAYADK